MFVRRTGSLFLVVGLLVMALAAGPAYAQQTVTLRASEFMFEPSSITVPAGRPVTFMVENVGQFPHDLHIEGHGVVFEVVGGGGNVAAGQSASGTTTFTTPGTYEFWCPVGNHRDRGMVGTLTVTAAGAPGAPAVGAPAQTPGALPRTGDAPSPAPGLLLLGGAVLVGLGWLLRRRGAHA